MQNSLAADERRRTQFLRSVSTLDDLQKELTKIGFNLSRSGLYLRLFYHNVATILKEKSRPTQFQRNYFIQKIHCEKEIDDRMFAKLFIGDIFEVCKLFGPKDMFLCPTTIKPGYRWVLLQQAFKRRC